tara:strand:- start:150 stop:578 length:429 start_codon:yes stop_codon:yes gene_type:complete
MPSSLLTKIKTQRRCIFACLGKKKTSVGQSIAEIKQPQNGLGALFSPALVTAVGASSDPATRGDHPVGCLLRAGFKGQNYRIGPDRDAARAPIAPGRTDLMPPPPRLSAVYRCVLGKIHLHSKASRLTCIWRTKPGASHLLR